MVISSIHFFLINDSRKIAFKYAFAHNNSKNYPTNILKCLSLETTHDKVYAILLQNTVNKEHTVDMETELMRRPI